jgi:hypothetical protein
MGFNKIGVLRLTQDEYRIYDLPFQTVNFSTVKLLSRTTPFGLIPTMDNISVTTR